MTNEERRAKPKLTRELLAAVALRIADAEGLDALSMRRLGAELGVDPMAAYRHFPNKKALLAGVVEAVLAGADVETDPRRRGRSSSRRWPAPIVRRRSPTSPPSRASRSRLPELARVTAHRRARRAILASAGVPRAAAVNAIQAVGQLSSGAVLLEAFWRE